MNVILLFACYGLALIAAYRLSTRLVGSDLLHRAALMLFLFVINLIVPATYAGIVNQLTLPGLMTAGVLLWIGEILLAERLVPLDAPGFVRTSMAEGPYLALWIGYALVATYAVFNLVSIVMGSVPVESSDSVWVYTPNAINFVQAGTLNSFQGVLAYFPAAYDMLYIWDIAFLRSITQIPALHSLLFVGVLLYSALLAQVLLRSALPLSRHLVTLVILALLLGSDLLNDMAFATAKNDILVLLGGLASTYYLLRYWAGKRDPRFLVLIGLACGVCVSTKLSAAFWIVAVGIAHLVLLAQADRRHLLRRLPGQALAAGLPLVILILPWIIRVALQPQALADSAEITTAGATHTIIQQWASPFYGSLTLFWIVPYVLVSAGNVALIVFAERLRRPWRVVAIASVVLGYAWLTITPLFDWQLGAFYTTLTVGVIVLAVWMRNRAFAPVEMLTVMLMAQIGMILLAFVPYSAWIDHFTWIDRYFFGINYRYAGAAYPLLLIANFAIIVHRLAPLTPAPEIDETSGFSRPIWRYGGIALVAGTLLILGGSLLQDEPGAQVSRVQDNAPVRTYVYTWLYEHVQGKSIYAINAPPLALYGRALANSVYYATPGHHGYFGNQAYQWSEIETLIDEYQIDYIVVSFAYPVFIQSRLLPSAEVDAEIALMRQQLDVAYEDAYVTIFAAHPTS